MKDVHTWERIHALVCRLAAQLRPEDYDAVLAITRGGMIPGCLISETLDIREVLTAAVMFYKEEGETLREPHFFQFPADPLLYGRRILVVDDVWDSGKTALAVKSRVLAAGGTPTVAVIHYKPASSRFPDERPDAYAEETSAWIVYPWELECSE
jgi:hypoxanthine phosphoribosyltransferase